MRVLRPAATVAIVLVAAMTPFASCRWVPPEVAGGLKKQSLKQVTLGMSPAGVKALLGVPLLSYSEKPTDLFLLYARTGGWKLIGMDHALQPRGASCFVVFAGDRLVKVALVDHDRRHLCGCVLAHCAEDWASDCQEAVPE